MKKVGTLPAIGIIVMTLFLIAIFSKPYKPSTSTVVPVQKIDDNQAQVQALQKIIGTNYKLTSLDLKTKHLVVYVEPLFPFASKFAIEAEAEKLVVKVNNAYPGNRVTVRIRKNLEGGNVKLFGEGYYDGLAGVTTKSY